jgi:hypothetical protein
MASEEMAAIRTAKKELRKSMKALLAKMDDAAVASQCTLLAFLGYAS